MARKSNRLTITGVISRLREAMPNICIRSSLIVGFPGETEEQFEALKDFIQEFQIDRLGVFTYSLEEGTKAALMENQIDEAVKEKRRDVLMRIQQKISLEKNKKSIGEELDMIIDGYLPDEDVYIGRSYKDAPNVDGNVFVNCPYELLTGQMIRIKIIEANEYDLIGEIDYEYCK
jgi:ribosomal protein S12 methylthiotransferase